MTRAEYIRKTQYNRRKKRILRVVKRFAVGLGCLVLTFLVCCGCIFVWDTFWGKEEGGGNGSLAANAAQNSGTVLGIHTELEGAEGLSGGQNTVLDGEAGLADATQSKDEGEEPLDEPKEPTVVVDAGHGGNDGGTYSGKIIEKDITLAVAKKMQKLLEEQPAGRVFRFGFAGVGIDDKDVFHKDALLYQTLPYMNRSHLIMPL